ncbi:hypothetical protein JW890_04435 [candidate division WOR-3 bacterium]|nr:hypothetical protein [candidate division WOR-3 bacterium]
MLSFSLAVVYFLSIGSFLPDGDFPWTVQLMSFSEPVYGNERIDEINEILWGQNISATGSYSRFFTVQGAFENKRVYRLCAGVFPNYQKASEMAYRLRLRGVPCFAKKIIGSAPELWLSTSVEKDRILLGQKHWVEIYEPGEIFWMSERAYVSDPERYATLVYSNGTGYEGEGENLLLLKIATLEESVILIDSRMITVSFWLENENQNDIAVIELISGATGYDNEVIILDCETREILERYEHGSVDLYNKSSGVLDVIFMSEDETVCRNIQVFLSDFR